MSTRFCIALLSGLIWTVVAGSFYEPPHGQNNNPMLGEIGEIANTYALAFSADGKRLAAGGSERDEQNHFLITIWDPKEKRALRKIIPPSRGSVEFLEFSPGDDYLLAVGSLYTEHAVLFLKEERKSSVFRQFENGSSIVRHSGFLSKKEIVCVTAHGIASVWNSENRQTKSFYLTSTFCKTAYVDRDREVVVWTDLRYIYVLRNRLTDATARSSIEHKNAFVRMTLDESCQLLVGATDEGQLTLFDLKAKRPRKEWQGHDGIVYAIARLKNGKGFVTGDGKGFIKFWSWNGDLLHSFTSTGGVSVLAISPDGSMMASSGEEQRIVLWDLTKIVR